jgi:TonB family protein
VKQNVPKNPKRKSFLRLPAYPGGKDAYLKFISDNMVYPEQALTNKVEGTVYLVYTVNNIGEIGEIEVSRGIGYGCDEEAVRVIRLMQYEPARNRGIKMNVEMKIKIHFKLPESARLVIKNDFQINYSAVPPENANSPESKSQAVYNYIINLDNKQD